MKSIIAMVVLVSFIVLPGLSFAATEVGNKICPVSGEKVPVAGEKGEMGQAGHFEYNGKIYNLCCTMCIKDFKKDPEKFSKKAEEEVAAEAGQK